MTHEISTIQKVDDKETFAKHARKILQELQNVNPDKIHCMMGIIVAESPNNNDNAAIHAFVLGNDEDIAKMLSSLVTVTRNGLVQAHTPSNHNNEVSH